MSARSDLSFPFWQSNVAICATFDCQNGEFWEADVTFGPPTSKRDEADQ